MDFPQDGEVGQYIENGTHAQLAHDPSKISIHIVPNSVQISFDFKLSFQQNS